MTASSAWPPLPYDAWKDTYATLHLWMQIVGKVALALAPPVNHCWQAAFEITPRGFSTRPLPHGDRLLSLEFDFIDHALHLRVSDGGYRRIALEPKTVALFLHEVMRALAALGTPVKIWPVAVELPSPIRLDTDMEHASYDGEQAVAAWRVFTRAAAILNEERAAFIGKCSPVHFFWGSFDLAVSRFSGRPAPAREGPAFMREAYSHEVISHGFWPGSGPLHEPAFYAYAVPEPEGLKVAEIEPPAAYYHREMGEFILPYEAVRTSPDPEGDIRRFVRTTYAAAARLADWDRALEK